MQGHLTMSHQELDRLQILQRVAERRMTQTPAAQALGLSYRQVKRLVANFRRHGAAGLVSRKRGQRSNRRLPSVYTDHILALVREHYADFGPTLAREKLLGRHALVIGRETLRGLMRNAGLWRTRAARRKAIQQPRARRQYFGELIQIDGSEHRWFEDRGPYCTILTYVDDATSRLQLLRFVEGESTFDYMQATKIYIERYGKPVALYSDKHSVFRVNKRSGVGGNGMTQYGRALHQLGIQIMCANTPAAKGRVERAHGTLQDRLVKEMRLEGISTIADANNWIDQFVETYNARFSKPPSLPLDLHRPLMDFEDLDDTFTWQEQRSLSASLTLQYDKVLYLVEPSRENQRLAGKRVTVVDYPDGRIKIHYEGRDLKYREFDKLIQTHQGEVISHKRLGAMLQLIGEQKRLLPPEKRSLRCPTRRYPPPGRLT
jgi:transposase